MNENKDLTTVPGSMPTLSSFRPPPGCQCALKLMRPGGSVFLGSNETADPPRRKNQVLNTKDLSLRREG